jgi:hypothetical protein
MLAAPAWADPASEACELVAVLADEGARPAVAFLEERTGHWSDDQRSKLGVVIRPELEKFTYVGGQVYRTAELPGAVEEYLLTVNLTGTGSVYLRLLYEGNGGEPALINIDFQASYYDVIERQFLQTPEAVDCPEE